MSYFKKFGDFCSGFACFAALIWLFSEFMSTKFDEELGLKEKIKDFIDGVGRVNNKLMLTLAIMLALSVLASIVFKRIPFVTPAFSVPPLMLSVDMVRAGQIEDYPMMYILLGGFSVLSGIAECVYMDRRDGGHRAALAGDAVALLAAGSAYFIWKRAEIVSAMENVDILELNVFDYEIYVNLGDMDTGILLSVVIAFLVLTAVSLILRDIYFIDAILSVAPLIVTSYMWSAGKITVHPELLVTVSAVYFAVRLIPALSGKPILR